MSYGQGLGRSQGANEQRTGRTIQRHLLVNRDRSTDKRLGANTSPAAQLATTGQYTR
jgi:hypothetical protein